jgi:glycosyltransferase involved in cell wall biosynthesis
MKISILTPSFNSGKYIERAIQSVLNQDYDNWEHIIVDGGSTDETPKIVKKYSHLRWISEPDKGQSDAMNKAFSKSTGDIILYLNADDEVREDLFPYIVEQFQNHPDIDMLVGNLEVRHPQEAYVAVSSASLEDALRFGDYKFPLNPVAYAYRRSLQLRTGPFPINNHYTMDYWFILRAFLFGRALKKEKVFGTFYFDGSNKSADDKRGRKELRAVKETFARRYFYYPRVAVAALKLAAKDSILNCKKLLLRTYKRIASAFSVLIIS